MPRIQLYELAYNWAGTQHHLFPRALTAAARHYRLRVLCVSKKDTLRIRRQVDQGRLRVGLFLNTQADGSNFESPGMLLCRSMKANGSLVVEDPDDAKVYADRALQLDYLGRAGLSVPRRYVLEQWRPSRPGLSAGDRARLGDSWVALPSRNMDSSKRVVSSARYVSPALSRAGFRAGQKILIRKYYEPLRLGGLRCRFRIWYFFGKILIGHYRLDRSCYEPLDPCGISFEFFARLLDNTRTLAAVSGLDWFASEMVVTRIRREKVLLIVEPPNALADLGPGVKATAEVPDEVLIQAAESIVETSWRLSRGLPLTDGMAVHLAAQ